MKCPFCGYEDTQVRDSRQTEDGASIRRRRSCGRCDGRFTTFERIQLRDLTVIKNNGDKEPFDREKLKRSMMIPLRKRSVTPEELDRAINTMVKQLESQPDTDITTRQIGELVMTFLAKMDQVAYVRYASVYKDFHEVSDFNEFVDDIKAMSS